MSEWTNSAPTQPGYFWYREKSAWGHYVTEVLHITPQYDETGEAPPVFRHCVAYGCHLKDLHGEWWTTPIVAPD
jgi:hypothetical protein